MAIKSIKMPTLAKSIGKYKPLFALSSQGVATGGGGGG